MSSTQISSQSTEYRRRFYTRYAELKQRTDVEQVRRDLVNGRPLGVATKE